MRMGASLRAGRLFDRLVNQDHPGGDAGPMRAAAVQLNSTDDAERNLATADRLTRAAAADGAELIVLPEKWSVLGSDKQMLAGAEPLEGGAALGWARDPAPAPPVALGAG